MLVIDVMMSRQNSTGGPYHHIPVMLNSDCTLIATDRDKNSIQYAEDLRNSHGDRFSFFISKFSKIPDLLRDLSINRVDGILLDLGVSSFQLDDPKRGFSFQSDGPLDMRMGENSLSAYDVVNKLKEIHLAEIIRDFGEERHARLVARSICKYRESKKN
jgi:16S rRNA (cytosine1402-N4)-methyltransferase